MGPKNKFGNKEKERFMDDDEMWDDDDDDVYEDHHGDEF